MSKTCLSLVVTTLLACCAREADLPERGVPGQPGAAEHAPTSAKLARPDTVARTYGNESGSPKKIVPDAVPARPANTADLPDGLGASKLAAIHPEDLVDLPPLIIVRRFDMKRFVLTPETEAGGFDEDDLALAREAWSWRIDHETHDVHPRLLDLLYGAVLHFDAPNILLTSGYRPDKVTSYHAHGRALDFQVPDVTCRDLAEHMRSYGFVGVGIYPRTGSVHLDVRQKSYFWISYAPRGVRWPEKGILHGLAKQMDLRAAERGVEPPEPLPEDAILARQRQALAQKRRLARRRSRKSMGAPQKAASRPTKAAKRPPRAR